MKKVSLFFKFFMVYFKRGPGTDLAVQLVCLQRHLHHGTDTTAISRLVLATKQEFLTLPWYVRFLLAANDLQHETSIKDSEVTCRPTQWQGRFWTLADLCVRPAVGFTHPPLEWVPATHSPEVKRHSEPDRLFPSSAEIKNEWSYTFPLHICLRGAHRANFFVRALYHCTDSAGRPTKSGIVGLHAYVAMELNWHFCTEYTPFACCCPSENGCTFF
jgi:hypothetical protein